MTNLLLFLQDEGAETASASASDTPLKDQLVQYAIDYGPKVALALAILIIGRWIAGILVGLLQKGMAKKGIDATLSRFLGSVVKALFMALVVLTAAGAVGVDTTSFAAILAAAGFAIGFALQGSLGSFAAGVMIITFRPFKAGDYVEVAGTAGIVREVGVFATVITTPDNKRIIVPNSSVTGGNIVNYSAEPTRRVDLVFGISYGDDVKKAKQVLERLCKEDERILEDPAPTIAVVELADSSVNLVCRPWVKGTDYWPVYFHMQEQALLQLDEAGLTIPFPQRDVHMHTVAS